MNKAEYYSRRDVLKKIIAFGTTAMFATACIPNAMKMGTSEPISSPTQVPQDKKSEKDQFNENAEEYIVEWLVGNIPNYKVNPDRLTFGNILEQNGTFIRVKALDSAHVGSFVSEEGSKTYELPWLDTDEAVIPADDLVDKNKNGVTWGIEVNLDKAGGRQERWAVRVAKVRVVKHEIKITDSKLVFNPIETQDNGFPAKTLIRRIYP